MSDNRLHCCSVFRYLVFVHIGNRWGADTDSEVWINIIGENGDTGKRFLHNSNTNELKFQRNQVHSKHFDVFDQPSDLKS